MLRCWFVASVLAASGWGCSWSSWFRPATTSNDAQRIAGIDDGGARSSMVGARQRRADDVVVVRLAFEVTRVIVPTSAMKEHRAQAWRSVDEMRIAPTLHASLARNGFRIGVLGSADRDALRSVLDDAGARYERVTHTVRDGVPLSIDLGSIAGSRDVFVTKADGRLVGKSFSDVARFIHVDYEVSVDGRLSTHLRLTPELFKESEHPEWSVRDGAPRYQKRYEGARYHELAAELDVAEGELLIVGPAEADGQPWTLGSTMLTDTVDGQPWETLLCIEPKVYRQADTPRRRP